MANAVNQTHSTSDTTGSPIPATPKGATSQNTTIAGKPTFLSERLLLPFEGFEALLASF